MGGCVRSETFYKKNRNRARIGVRIRARIRARVRAGVRVIFRARVMAG